MFCANSEQGLYGDFKRVLQPAKLSLHVPCRGQYLMLVVCAAGLADQMAIRVNRGNWDQR